MKSDVVIVGGGPAGSAAAMFLIREGIQPVIIEAETFPRYHIGESMTGEAGAVLRNLGLEDTMNRHRFPVKHGVKVYGPKGAGHWFVPVAARTPEGEFQDVTTWQVRRNEFDKLMLDEAVARGATLVKGKATRPLLGEDGSVRGTEVRTEDGSTMEVTSDVLLDCSGIASFLANAGVTGPKYRGNYDKQIAIFSQVAHSVRDFGDERDQQPGNTIIFYKEKYHWAWFIPLDDEVVSVGVVAPSAYFLEQQETTRDYLLRELKELNPELARRTPQPELVEDVHVIPNYSYQVKRFCGKGYICLGDAHRFVDPIFSFGLYIALKEAEFVAPVVRAYLEGANRDAANPFADYQRHCEAGIDVLEDTIDLFWEQPYPFAFLVHHRYREDLMDVFAGRIYEGQPNAGVRAFRKMLDRERTYDSEDVYSVPVGSRYHPERAPLWEAASPVQSTEAWIGPR